MKHKTQFFRISHILAIWFGVTVAWSIYRFFGSNSELTEELILKPLFFLGPVLIYAFWQKSLTLEILGLTLKNPRHLIKWGLGIGLFLIGENILISILKHEPVNLAIWTGSYLVDNGLISLATAFSEEFLYRGFLMGQFWLFLKQESWANLATAVLFSLGHLPIAIFVLNYSGGVLISYLGLVFLLGVVNGIAYGRTKSVFTSTLVHALWNFSNTWFGS